MLCMRIPEAQCEWVLSAQYKLVTMHDRHQMITLPFELLPRPRTKEKSTAGNCFL